MDAAETWLVEHDLDYQRTKQAWKDLDGGVYRTPPQEIPWGTAADIALLVDSGGARYVEPVESIACERCGNAFAPATGWQRFCSELCQQAARTSRAGYMRDYRRRAA